MTTATNPTFRIGLKATGPTAPDMIDDLLESHRVLDPTNEDGFASRDLWNWRLEQYGYLQLFSDWLLIAEQV